MSARYEFLDENFVEVVTDREKIREIIRGAGYDMVGDGSVPTDLTYVLVGDPTEVIGVIGGTLGNLIAAVRTLLTELEALA